MDEQPIAHEDRSSDDPNLYEETISDREEGSPEETIAPEPEDRPDPEAADVDPAEIEAEPPAGADAGEPVADEEKDQPAPGTPGIPPPARTRTDEHGIAQTTTTGDPEKDFRGPSVTEEARRRLAEEGLLGQRAGDVGHEEDVPVLRRGR
jgi:hypothetical protein